MPPRDEPGTVVTGASTERAASTAPPNAEPRRRSRVGRAFSGGRDLWRLVYRDPEHVSERLTLYAADHLSEPSRKWAQSSADRPSRYPHGKRTLLFYDGEAASVLEAIRSADQRRDQGHEKRAILRTLAISLSILVPIAFIAYIDHVHKTTGFNWLAAVGALVALSLVMAIGAVASRK